jgi:hypothetical protein
MTYHKTIWVNDSTPAIQSSNLNHIETGIWDTHHGLVDQVKVGGTTAYMQAPVLTVTQRNALTPQDGTLIYNASTGKFQVYSSVWATWLNVTLSGDTFLLSKTLIGANKSMQSKYRLKGLAVPSSSNHIATKQYVDAAGQAIKSKMIIAWSGTIATIPSKYFICDGNNGTPNMLDRFIVGVPTAATSPGTTGGSTNLTDAGHTHTSVASTDVGTGAVKWIPTTGIVANETLADGRPLFYALAFIMRS